MKADTKTRSEIVKKVKEMWAAHARRDVEGVLSFYARDSDGVVLGSGPDEKYIGPKGRTSSGPILSRLKRGRIAARSSFWFRNYLS